ncbi:MAG: hypothetical protein J5693_07210 [Bacteroidales bacterium]|nr:hypothetical protein [Bacteroidales bacterium]
MKRLLVISILIAFSVAAAGQSITDGVRYWKDGPLTWDDFNLKPTKDSTLGDLSFRWLYESDTTRLAWNTVRYGARPEVVLYKPTSWHNADKKYQGALEVNQLLFDLNEIYFRKLLTEYNNPNNDKSFNLLSSFYSEEVNYKIHDLLENTRSGLDTTAIRIYRSMVDAELAATSYPEPNAPKMKVGLTYHFGAAARMFLGEPAATFSPAIGMELGMTFMFNRHYIGLLLSPASGQLKNDFIHDGYNWKSGDRYDHSIIGLTYGYILYHGYTFSITPMVGIGGRMINWSEGVGKDKIADGCGSTAVLGGLETNFIFLRNIRGDAAFEHAVSLKTYVAKDIDSDGINGWSLNFGLSYSIGFHD